MSAFFALRNLVAVPVGLLIVGAAAHAEVPAAVSSALTDAKADGITVAGLVLVVIIAIAAFKYIRKAL